MGLNRLLKYLLETESWEQASNTRKIKGTPPEAPEDAPLGQYLFAPARSDVPIPKEINTELEKQLSKDLGRHFEGEGDIAGIEKSLVTLKGFEKQGLYKKLLSPPTGKAYRFIKNIKPEQASKLFLNGFPVEAITANPNVAFHVGAVGTVERPSASSTVARGETNISSWTIAPTKPHFADFCSTRPELVAILLVADIQSNEFFLNPDNITAYAQADRTSLDASLIKREREVIAFGPVNVIDATVIYIKPSISENEFDSIRSRCPSIEIYNLNKVTNVPASVFRPTYEYIKGYVDKYAGSLEDYALEYISTKNIHYQFLKALAENGLDFKDTKMIEFIKDNILLTREPEDVTKITSEFLIGLRYKLIDIPGNILVRLIRELKATEKITNYSGQNGIPIQKELLRALSLEIETPEL